MKRNTVIFECSVIGPKMSKISILQVNFLEILNISRTRNENFDKFFDPKEPVYNIFRPIPEHSKITVFLFIQSPQ